MIELLTIEQTDAWNAALARAGATDVFYQPGYLRPLAMRGEGQPVLFFYDEGGHTAAHVTLLRPLSTLPFAHPFDNYHDAISPYGYSGPIVSNPTVAPGIWQAWTNLARKKNIIAEFIRFHPLLRTHSPFLDLLDVRRAGTTVWMDLTGNIEKDLTKSRRNEMRYAVQKGITVSRVGKEYIPTFGAVYRQTMQRRNALDYYMFDDDYFMQMADGLGDDFWLIRAAQGDEDCSYTLCLRGGDLLHYHLSCSVESKNKTRSVVLLLLEAARLGQHAGCRRFHLGGGYRGEDSLFSFKATFSPNRSEFFVGRAVHDEQAVIHLTEIARKADKAPIDANFFPPYRSGR